MPDTCQYRIGVAGWSYPDWDGRVYPAKAADKLRYVAGFVDMIEIDNTFYSIPRPAVVESWNRRTCDLPDFRFAAKLNQRFTHEAGFNTGDIDAFNAAMRPLSESGRLEHLLAQFRWDFTDSQDSRDRLCRINDGFHDTARTLTLELRHNSWEQPSAQGFLAALGIGLANLDYPLADNSFTMQVCTLSDHAYLRLHGRNKAAWFDSKAGRDETYNYCYSDKEIKDISGRANAIGSKTKTLTIVANNHYKGKAMLNALELKNSLTGKQVDASPELVHTYPRLRRIASNPPPPKARQGDLGL